MSSVVSQQSLCAPSQQQFPGAQSAFSTLEDAWTGGELCGGRAHHFLLSSNPPAGSSHISCTIMLVMHYVLSALSEVGQCTSTEYTCNRWNEHTSPHTVHARLGSAPLFSRVSTTSVFPNRQATNSGLIPSCTVCETILLQYKCRPIHKEYYPHIYLYTQ